jgi:hypothetical protein
MKSKKLIKKIIILTISVILTVFIVFNIVWFSYYNYVTDNFVKKVGKEELGGLISYKTKTDTHTFRVEPSGYLHFNAFLGVSKKESSNTSLSSDGKTITVGLENAGSANLLVWIPFNREPYYGAQVFAIEPETNDTVFYSYYIDKDGNLSPGPENWKYSEEEVKVFETGKAAAAELLEQAKERWPELNK